jgi:hypothetical protein
LTRPAGILWDLKLGDVAREINATKEINHLVSRKPGNIV